MKISETQLKNIIKEEIMKEISLSTVDSATDKVEDMPGMGSITIDRDVLTIAELEGFLKGLGEKGKENLAQLEEIMAFVDRVSTRNDNITTNGHSRLDIATKSMQKKICGMALGDTDTNSQLFWQIFEKNIDFDGYDCMSTKEAKKGFNLTDDEAYAYSKFVERILM